MGAQVAPKRQVDMDGTQKKIVITKEAPLKRRLAQLGLDVETLQTAALRAVTARLTCGGYYPPFAPGLFQFVEAVAALREQQCPRGWEPDDSENFCTVISPDRKVAIAVAAGDASTGDPDRSPSTQHPKGPVTVAAVMENQLYFIFRSIGGAETEDDRTGDDPSKPKTWFLLIASTPTEIRTELSLPETINEKGWITSWRTRLILPTIPLSKVDDVSPSDDGGDEGDVIDIDIRKRD